MKYSNPYLPPLLKFLDGTPVKTIEDWEKRRSEIRELMCRYFIGTVPDTPPALLSAEVVGEEAKGSSTIKRVKLTFDTKNKFSCELTLWVPEGDGPFPVVMVQPIEYQYGWAEAALARRFLVCLYPGTDGFDPQPDYPGYESVWRQLVVEYPELVWTEISAKAWLAGRALDYLLDPKYATMAAEGKVGILGHSRHGKQSLMAAAMDERITSVMARSPGSPGICPYRFTSRHSFAETPEDFPFTFPHNWFRLELRGFTGRENELPIDAHGWVGLIAPRHCMVHTAHHDGCDPTFAAEQSYLEGKTVYEFLGKPENFRLDYREGAHGPITDEHRQHDMDWFEHSWGIKKKEYPEVLIHHFDWKQWRSKLSAEDLKVPEGKRERILWALGQEPKIEWDGNLTFTSDADNLMMERRLADCGTAVSFGENVHGYVHYDKSIKEPMPVIIWLHPYSYHSGCTESYGVQGMSLYQRFTEAGFLVLGFDQTGCGLRLLECQDFYQKYPKWSRLGRMVHDVKSAVDFLVEGKGIAKEPLPPIDKNRLFCLGYSMGGMVGLYATALDERIKAVSALCAFTPLRNDTDQKSTGGIRRLWELHSLQPLLGLYNGCENEIPYDFEDIFELIAPRPCQVTAPQLDREADLKDVISCVSKAGSAWAVHKLPYGLNFNSPVDFNRFQADQQQKFIEWTKWMTSMGIFGS
jgi:pimeloyl-ACP methyl ester carboxylesterase